jgi:hypothetical protein
MDVSLKDIKALLVLCDADVGHCFTDVGGDFAKNPQISNKLHKKSIFKIALIRVASAHIRAQHKRSRSHPCNPSSTSLPVSHPPTQFLSKTAYLGKIPLLVYTSWKKTFESI